MNELKASEVALTERVVDGKVYSEASARGWSTGPCSSVQAALERLDAYHSGHRISEAAPGMASRTEMAAAAALFAGRRRIRGMNHTESPGELHSDRWIRATNQIIAAGVQHEPEFQAATKLSARIRLGSGS